MDGRHTEKVERDHRKQAMQTHRTNPQRPPRPDDRISISKIPCKDKGRAAQLVGSCVPKAAAASCLLKEAQWPTWSSNGYQAADLVSGRGSSALRTISGSRAITMR